MSREEKLLIIKNDWCLIRKIRYLRREGGFLLGEYISTKDVWIHMKKIARVR